MTDFYHISSRGDVDNALKLLHEMLRIRAVEEEIAARYGEQKNALSNTFIYWARGSSGGDFSNSKTI